jgi:hypothetical protein
MTTMPVRRLGALLAAAVVLTIGTAFATDLNLTAPSRVGVGQQAITAPCTSVIATVQTGPQPHPSPLFPAYVLTVRLAGTGCTGTSLTVQVTLKDGATNPVTTVTGVAGTAINSGLSVDVSNNSANTTASALQSIAVLVTGS